MKRKKVISLILSALLLCGSVSASFESIAAKAVSADSFAEAVAELTEEESREGKSIEESAASRVILKAAKQPDIYGTAECIKGTAGKFILQYATEAEAAEALGYYRSFSFVQWAELDRETEMQAMNYGNYMLGSDEAMEYIQDNRLDTAKTTVAVIDTGIDVSSPFYTENERMIDSGINLSTSGDENSANDDKGHGTNVCAIVLDNTDENVDVVAYKVLNNKGSGSDLAVATAIDLAVEAGVDIINLSLGGEGETTNVLMESLENAFDHDVTVVVAAGNDGRDVKDFSPASVDECITVAAIDQNGNQDFYSNFGEGVDFAAPGHLLMNQYGEYTDVTCETVVHNTGTSFAAPFVAAAAAMVKAVNPDYTREDIEQSLINSCVGFDELHYHDGFHRDIEFFLHTTSPYWDGSCGGDLQWADYPTPENKAVYYGNGMPQTLAALTGERAQKVDFSVDSGHFVDRTFTVTLSSEEGASIYYTTDESYPSKYNGTLYNGGVRITETQSIRAVAYVEGKAPSVPAAREYRTEFHDSEKRFKITADGSITAYTGTVKELIIPETIKGITVRKLGYEVEDPGFSPMFDSTIGMQTTQVKLTSINLPATLEESNGIQNDKEVKFVTINGKKLLNTGVGVGMYDESVYYHPDTLKHNHFYYNNVVSIIAPNLERIERPLAATYIQEAYFPKCTYVCDDAFKGIETLKKVTLGEGAYIGKEAFKFCYGLREINAPKMKTVMDEAFCACCRIQGVDFSELEYAGNRAFALIRHIKGLVNCPKLKYCGVMSFPVFIRTLYVPELEEADYYPCYEENPEFIVSSKFQKCDLTVNHFKDPCLKDPNFEKYRGSYYWDLTNLGNTNWENLTIYGTPGTFVQQFARENKYSFVELPMIREEPENMGADTSYVIKADVWGFNKQMQWYGTNRKDNHGGIPLSGENEETLDTSKYNYRYYYCKVKTADGDYKKNIVTGESNLSFYDYQKDKSISVQDVSLLIMYLGKKANLGNEKFDINEDGIIDMADLSILLSSEVYGKTY